MIRAVLFDRDGTLVADGACDRTAIVPMPCANEAVQLLRGRGLRVGVATNQPWLASGEVSSTQINDLHERIERAIGPIDGWFICPHAAGAGCGCRKPQPGLILRASRTFGIEPHECAMVGDIGSDVDAARNAGAYGVLVPTAITRDEEIAGAPVVFRNLADAAEHLLQKAAQ